MKNFNFNPKTLTEAAKVVGYHCKEVEEMAVDTARKMMRDQSEWLDSVMKDLLPPDLYKVGQTGEDPGGKIAEYVQKHGIEIVYIADSLRIRVMLHGKPYAEFVPTFTVDGEEVKWVAESVKPNNN